MDDRQRQDREIQTLLDRNPAARPPEPKDYPTGYPKSIRELAFLFLLLVGVLASLASWEYFQRAGLPKELLRLESADPVADCEKAFERGDYRLMGVQGYSLDVPGQTRAKQDHGVCVIPGTDDVIESYEHWRLQGIARKYAVAYNERMLKLLDGQ